MGQVPDPKEQVFTLATGCDPTQLELSGAQGYLLSRIDGATPWRLLREIGGIPPDDVDACLEDWLAKGFLEVVGAKASRAGEQSEASGGATSASATKPAPATDAAEAMGPPTIDENALDDRLEIDTDVQRRILEYEASLGLSYHVLLGVPVGAEPKVVKRAYFKLSKEFHPDRYFRKEIGDYGARLDRIFKRILEAHEILSDPELCKVANQAAAGETHEASNPAPAAGPAATAASAATSPTSPAKPKTLTKLERLQQRMPFKINHAAIAERRARADEIFRAAQSSQQAGRLQEAEASIRIAISFDPGRSEFKEALGSLRIAAAGARASKLLASPSDRMSNTELLEALHLLEDVLPYRPHDPELNERAARVCMQLGKFGDAQEYAETLLIRMPESSSAYSMLGRIHREQGDTAEAVRALETALKYDEENMEARRALASVRIGARDAARGGRS